MPLRKRISLLAAASVAIGVAIAVMISYFVVRRELFSQVDTSLRANAATILSNNHISFGQGAIPQGSPRSGGPDYEQLVLPNGSHESSSGVTLPYGQLARRWPADSGTRR